MEQLVANAMASVLNEEEFAKRLIIQELMQKGPSVLENLGGNDNKQKKNKKKNKKSNFDVEMATNLFEKAQKQAQEQDHAGRVEEDFKTNVIRFFLWNYK